MGTGYSQQMIEQQKAAHGGGPTISEMREAVVGERFDAVRAMIADKLRAGFRTIVYEDVQYGSRGEGDDFKLIFGNPAMRRRVESFGVIVKPGGYGVRCNYIDTLIIDGGESSQRLDPKEPYSPIGYMLHWCAICLVVLAFAKLFVFILMNDITKKKEKSDDGESAVVDNGESHGVANAA